MISDLAKNFLTSHKYTCAKVHRCIKCDVSNYLPEFQTHKAAKERRLALDFNCDLAEPYNKLFALTDL